MLAKGYFSGATVPDENHIRVSFTLLTLTANCFLAVTMTKNRPSDVFDPPDPKIFDGPALTRWMEIWRFSATALADRLGVTTQTLGNWRRSGEPLRPWIRLALEAIEADEERKRVNGGS